MFWLAGDKLMPEMYLMQPGFRHSACGPFTQDKKGIEKNQKDRRFKKFLSKRIR